MVQQLISTVREDGWRRRGGCCDSAAAYCNVIVQAGHATLGRTGPSGRL
jgi:hypothetical protein